jgi:hypothetical protein
LGTCEILAFAKAKKEKHVARLNIIDAWNKFETNVTKWNKISTKVMSAKFSTQMRNGVAYKDKWALLHEISRRSMITN